MSSVAWKPASITVSNTPRPPGTWLTRPTICAITKIARKCPKAACRLSGISTYITAAASHQSSAPTSTWRSAASGRGSSTRQRHSLIGRRMKPPRTHASGTAVSARANVIRQSLSGRPEGSGTTSRVTPVSASRPSQKLSVQYSTSLAISAVERPFCR